MELVIIKEINYIDFVGIKIKNIKQIVSKQRKKPLNSN
jgi:hypothetical protein